MKTLKESLLTNTSTKVSKVSTVIKIDSWMKKNLPDNVGKYTVSQDVNADGKYVVTLHPTGRAVWPYVNLDFKGNETTNGMFVFDIDKLVRVIYISGVNVKVLDGLDGMKSHYILGIVLNNMTNLSSIAYLPPTKDFTMKNCSKIKAIKLPHTAEYGEDMHDGVSIENCYALSSIEFVCPPTKLDIRHCPKPIKFINAPDKFGKLSFRHCSGIKNLKGLPSKLSNLEILDCNSFSSLKGDVKVIYNNLKLCNCRNFTNFKGIPTVEYTLFVENCPITDWNVERKGKWFNAVYKNLPAGMKHPKWGVDGY